MSFELGFERAEFNECASFRSWLASYADWAPPGRFTVIHLISRLNGVASRAPKPQATNSPPRTLTKLEHQIATRERLLRSRHFGHLQDGLLAGSCGN